MVSIFDHQYLINHSQFKTFLLKAKNPNNLFNIIRNTISQSDLGA